MVGDHVERDVFGAQRAGIGTVAWVDRGSDPPPADLHGALRIAHLGELAALLEKIRPDT